MFSKITEVKERVAHRLALQYQKPVKPIPSDQVRVDVLWDDRYLSLRIDKATFLQFGLHHRNFANRRTIDQIRDVMGLPEK